jgi:HTH-type transcriptional regulator / antitoxin HipB
VVIVNITNTHQLKAYLKDIRMSQNLSQTKVGGIAGIRQDTVSSFEQNPDSTKLDTFFKILSALDLELEIRPKRINGSDELKSDNKAWSEEW